MGQARQAKRESERAEQIESRGSGEGSALWTACQSGTWDTGCLTAKCEVDRHHARAGGQPMMESARRAAEERSNSRGGLSHIHMGPNDVTRAEQDQTDADGWGREGQEGAKERQRLSPSSVRAVARAWAKRAGREKK